MSTKNNGNGNFGIKIVYDGGNTAYVWFEDMKTRDREYKYAMNSRARRVASGVPHHVVKKVKR